MVDAAGTAEYECRAREDDAWYNVAVALSEDGETLTMKFQRFDDWVLRFAAGEFKSAAYLDELLTRFRLVSKQVKDDECGKVIKGMTVCPALSYRSDDLRFYDAVVEDLCYQVSNAPDVEHQVHAITDGEDECLCSFMVAWQHGPMFGNFSLVKIANICSIQAAALADPGITCFSKLVKERILAACSKSCMFSEHCNPGGPLRCKELSLNEKSSSERRLQDSEVESYFIKRREGKERFNFSAHSDGDEDVGGSEAAKSGGCYFVLIDNLEKDLSTSAIRQFIRGYTLVSPQAYLFPSRTSMASGSGAIASDSKENIQKIFDFLVHSKHLIVSSRGRPWVVYEKVLDGSSSAALGSLLYQSQDEFKWRSLKKELILVHLGTEAYNTAKQLRDLFEDFLNHEQLLYQRLALEEAEILKSSHLNHNTNKGL